MYVNEIEKVAKDKLNVVCFDFDGVIHSYKSGWKGVDVIPDPPVDGIKDEIAKIRQAGYKVIVCSARCAEQKGINAIKKWLDQYGIVVDGVQTAKPAAICYIDDNAVEFKPGMANKLLKIIKERDR